MMTAGAANPHANQPVLHHGPPLTEARLVVIAVHGRGASANDILSLARELCPGDVACLAPEAAQQTWYPYTFLSPLDRNEPQLTSALGVIETLIAHAGTEGLTADRIVLLGFSQGACLSLEFAARHAQRYGAVVGLSGGLIGPPGTPRAYGGSLSGTPVFLGCSDVDPHIPVERVRESAEVLRALGATVDERIYPRMGHTVNDDEIRAVRALLGDTSQGVMP
jgi:predicted esterase